MGILDMVAAQMEIDREDFMAFERLRESGRVNMAAIREVCDITGLDREQVKNIIKNYEALAAKYLEVKA